MFDSNVLYNLNTFLGNDERFLNNETISKIELNKLYNINKKKFLLDILENNNFNMMYKLKKIEEINEINNINSFQLKI